MLRLFKTNQLLLSVLLIGYAAILRIAYFQIPLIDIPTEPGIGNYILTPYIQEPSFFSYSIIVFLLTVQAFIVNKIFFEHRFYRDLSLYPGIFLILLSSIIPDFLSYSSYFVANIFVLLALRESLKIYRTTSSADIIFNSGFFLGLASCFQPVYTLILFAIAMALVNLKSGKFRDQFTSLAGFFTPLFLIGTIYFTKGQFDVFWNQQWTDAFSLPQLFDWHKIPIPVLILMSFLLLFTIFQQTNIMSKTKMEIQAKVNVIYWFLAAAGLSILLSPSWNNFHWQALTPFMGLLLGIHFTKTKGTVAEAWHLILIIILFAFHFTQSFSIFFS